MWDAFCNILNEAIELYVPFLLYRNSNRTNARTRYPNKIKNKLDRKKCLWKQVRAKPNNMLCKAKYRTTCNEFRRLITEFEKEKELNIIKANNVGDFYKYTNNKLNHSKGISLLIDANGKLLTDDLDKATIQNNFFDFVGITDNGHRPTCTPPDIDDALCSVIFTPTAVLKAIKK